MHLLNSFEVAQRTSSRARLNRTCVAKSDRILLCVLQSVAFSQRRVRVGFASLLLCYLVLSLCKRPKECGLHKDLSLPSGQCVPRHGL